jgi:hypothetical protein
MATSKDDLIQILKLLASDNDTNWTDDGLPRVDAVQKIAKDLTITRANINDACPGFARNVVSAEAIADVAEYAEANPLELLDGDDGFDPAMEPEIDGSGPQLSEDQVRAILSNRIDTANQNLNNAQRAAAEAVREVRRCEVRLDKAHTDKNRRFPAITAAANIKQHLAAQQQRLLENVTGTGANGRDQLDQAMEKRNSRGWSRPSRPVVNARAR